MSDAIRRLAKRLAKIERRQLALETAPRLQSSSIEYGGRIDEVDPATGDVVARFGTQPDGTHGLVHVEGPTPPAPSVPLLVGAPGLVTVTWDGLQAGGVATPLDFRMVEVYVAAAPFAFIEDAFLAGSVVGVDGDAVTIAVAPGVWHVGLVTVSQAMKRSPVSGLASVEVAALPSEEDVALAGGRVTISLDEPEPGDADGKPDNALWQQVVDDVLVGAWRLDAAEPEWRPIEVVAGTPYMPKVDIGEQTVGVLTGARLAADAIDGKTITGATFRTSAVVGPVVGGEGVVMDEDGLRSFRADGAQTFGIDAETGGVSALGRFLVGAPDARMTIDEAFDVIEATSAPSLRWTSTESAYEALISAQRKYDSGTSEDRGFALSLVARGPGSSPTLGGYSQLSCAGSGAFLASTERVSLRSNTTAEMVGYDESIVAAGGSSSLIGKLRVARSGTTCEIQVGTAASTWSPLFATVAETIAGTSIRQAVTPASLAGRTATTTRTGLVELATDAEVIAATDTTRAVTPANLAAWKDAQFRVAFKTANQALTASGAVISGLQLFAPRAGRVRVAISCTSYSSSTTDLISYQIRNNTAQVKGGSQMANSHPTSAGTGHLMEMSAILDVAANDSITVYALRAVGSGNITIAGSATDPSTLTLEYV